MAIFGFESFSAEDVNCKDTESKTLIEKHIPTSVSMSSILIPKTIFLCNPYTGDLVSYFIEALDSLATKIKIQMIVNFHQTETAMRSKLVRVSETLNQ